MARLRSGTLYESARGPIAKRKTTPRTFKQFSKLPTELRIMIWRMSFQSRIVTVKVNDIGDKIVVRRRTKQPSTLAANRESQFEILRFYAPLYRILQVPIYFHPSMDSLTTGTSGLISSMSAPFLDLGRLQTLASMDSMSTLAKIESIIIHSYCWKAPYFVRNLKYFRSLAKFHKQKTLVLQLSDVREVCVASLAILDTESKKKACREAILSELRSEREKDGNSKWQDPRIIFRHNRKVI